MRSWWHYATANMSEKAKALLKQGRQAFYALRLDDAETMFREAKDLAIAGQHRRLYARAPGGLQNALGYRGRMGEPWDEGRNATARAIGRADDGPATLLLQSLLFQLMPPQRERRAEPAPDSVTRT